LPERVVWEIAKEVHKLLIHFGTDKVHDFLKRVFHEPNFARIARDVVTSCDVCQATKFYTRPYQGVQYFELPDMPGDILSLDIYGPLPRSMQGDKFVLVAMDLFSKYMKLYPMSNMKLDRIMEQLKNGFFQEIVPKIILTDNGTPFSVDRWQQFANEHGFEVRRTMLCNPQSNPVERVMRRILIRPY